MKILVYIFESFKAKETLEKLGEVVVIKKPRVDIEHLCSLLTLDKYDLVLGVARSRGRSVVEQVAVNNIHGHKIDKDGPETLPLFVPFPIPFSVASRPTSTFCNYTMYKVAKFLMDKKLGAKFMFFHLMERDLEKLVSFIQNGILE